MSVPGQVFDFSLHGNSTLIGMLNKIDSFTDVGQGGIIGILILIVVGGALLLMMKSFGNERAMPVSLLITSVIGILLRIMGLVGDKVFWICVALTIVSATLLLKEQSQYE